LHASPFVLTWNLYAGVPGLQGADRGPRAHLGRDYERVGGANFSASRSVILIFLLRCPPGGAGAEDLGAPTINVKTSTTGPWKVPELKV
jgi:hypothetical protein